MKKWCLGFLAMVSCAFAGNADLEREEQLCAKAVLENKMGYFVLADGSCWKAVGFSPRWRSISEWWNGVELAPQQYKCEPNDWFIGTVIQAYPKNSFWEVNEADAANQEDLKQCTHILVNARTSQVLFAIAMDTSHCIVDLHREAYKDGHAKGMKEGYAKQREHAASVYDEGYAAGYKSGYKEGCKEGYEAAISGRPFQQE